VLCIRDPHQQFSKAKDAVDTLGSMSRLRTLDLYGSHCDDDTMQAIGKMTKLESLHLTNVTLSDKGLKSLQSIESLREIYLFSPLHGNPNITEEGLAGFAKLKKLESLSIHAINVSGKAIDALRAKLPNVQIEFSNKRPMPKR